MYLFSNILGVFVFDENLNLADEALSGNPDDHQSRENFIKKIRDKHKNLKEPDKEKLKKILLNFKDKKFFDGFYNKNLEWTKYGIKNSVGPDTLLMQSINSVDELEKTINILVKRLRGWYELHNPEFSISIANHENFVEQILENEKNDLLSELKLSPSESVGADLNQEDLEPIKWLAHQVYGMYQLRKSQLEYLSNLMDGLCPNIKALSGVLIGARLIEHAGSLKRLSQMPASTIQVLGAESALFRHMRTGARPPRHGIIVHHDLIANAPDKMHGRIARALADKISIASKVDYFQGKFIGDTLRKELEKKFNLQK